MDIRSSSRTSNNRRVGYRFLPSDEELVGVYLSSKVLNRDSLVQLITLPEINNPCEFEPWQLPGLAWPSEIDPQNRTWYFFCRRNPNCKRVKRVTKAGFWSITGDKKQIRDAKTKEEIGLKRIMTFYVKDPVSNKKKKENKTPWVIHEYYLPNQTNYVLCKLTKREDETAHISIPDDLREPLLACNDDVDIRSTLGFGESHFDSTACNQQNMDVENGGSGLPFSGAMSRVSAESPFEISRVEDGELNTGAETEVVSSQMITFGQILVVANFILELPSVVLDQLSSVPKPLYALLLMLLSFASLVLCIVELVYQGRNKRVPLSNVTYIVGFTCAVCQSLLTTANYVLLIQHTKIQIQISVWPVIFAFVLLCSKICDKTDRSERERDHNEA